MEMEEQHHHHNHAAPATVVMLQELFPHDFEFDPTDVELIKHYLEPKQENCFPTALENRFLDVELDKFSPEELVDMHVKLEANQQNWYFFTRSDRKHQNSVRPSRQAKGGYWKATTGDMPIRGDDGSVVGYKKLLAFYEGRRSGGVRRKYKMQEYLTTEQRDETDLPSTNHNPTKLYDVVLCKIYQSTRRRSQNDSPQEENHPQEELQSTD